MLSKGTPIPKDQLTRLYYQHRLSLSEIATKLKVSVHKVTYWMDKHNIQTRDPSTAMYYKLNPNGDPFEIKNKLTIKEVKLKYLALGLFWGEGGKTNKHSVRLGNTDPALIKKFKEFLLHICRVKNHKITYWLQTFKDSSSENAVKYWSNALGINSDKVRTSKPIPSQEKGTYKRFNKNGVMTILVANIKLRAFIEQELIKLGYSTAIQRDAYNVK